MIKALIISATLISGGTFTEQPPSRLSGSGFLPLAYDIQTIFIERVTSAGSSQETTIDDIVFDESTGATVVSDYQVTTNVVERFQRLPAEEPTVTSANTGILSNPSDAVMSYVSDGSTDVIVASSVAEQRIPLDVFEQEGQTVFNFNRYVPGSLARHISDSVDDRLTLGGGIDMYSTWNSETHTYVRNASAWFENGTAIDFSGLAASNNSWGTPSWRGRRAGTLFSPKHFGIASHYSFGPGNKLWFVGNDGTIHERTVGALMDAVGDLRIGILTEALPASVKVSKVMPDDWADYLPSYTDSTKPHRVPAVSSDQERRAPVRIVAFGGTLSNFSYPYDETRQTYYRPAVSGDSGSPVWTVINNDPVLLTVWTSPSSGTSVTANKPAIQSAMDTLSGFNEYDLQEVDLSGFTDFSE